MPTAEQVTAEAQREAPLIPAKRERAELLTLTLSLLCLATSWWLLTQLAVVLRPLFLAVFLGYIILPLHYRLSPRLPGLLTFAFLVSIALLVLLLLSLLVYASVQEFNKALPELLEQGRQMARQATAYTEHNAPWLAGAVRHATNLGGYGADALRSVLASVLGFTTNFVVEAAEVVFYLVFLIFEVGRLPQRIRDGFADGRAQHIERVIHRINEAMATYLSMKVRTSLLLAAPVAVVLWLFDVRFVLLWFVLFFLSNFITYFGSIVSCILAILFAFFQFGFEWHAVVVSLLIVAIRVGAIDLAEPALTGRAVDLSPLLILVALAFWGLAWGWVGMLLAVPLTVMIKIVMENIHGTQPLARLMSED
jgi:predicted PurR-regulated permease PerM